MKIRNVVIVIWLGIMALVIASLAMTAKVQAQSCDPATGACPPPSSGGGSGGKKKPPIPLPSSTPTSTVVAMIQTWTAETETAGAPLSKPDNPISLTVDACITATLQSASLTEAALTPPADLWTPPPNYQATQSAAIYGCNIIKRGNVIVPPVAGPVFLRPGVINIIVGGLVVVLAGALILVFRNR